MLPWSDQHWQCSPRPPRAGSQAPRSAVQWLPCYPLPLLYRSRNTVEYCNEGPASFDLVVVHHVLLVSSNDCARLRFELLWFDGYPCLFGSLWGRCKSLAGGIMTLMLTNNTAIPWSGRFSDFSWASRGCLLTIQNYYISQWYKRDECGFRMALFFSAATLAGAFGGILARGIAEMSGVGRRSAWSWICKNPFCSSISVY